MKITPRNLEIIAAYKKHRAYQSTGDALGISRQRVEQIVNKVAPYDKEVTAIKNRFDHSKESCLVCNRSFTEVVWSWQGVCGGCRAYQRSSNKHRRRNLSMPKACKCGVVFVNKWPTERCPGDLCNKCYAKTDRYKKDQINYKKRHRVEINARLAKYYKEVWYPKNKEKKRGYDRKNYARHKERYKELNKKRYLKNRDHYIETYRQRYIKVRLNLEDLT